ncbi:MAG: hypothetical protein H7234_06490 [Herminiimonas sp.]|nr:hypothetical protein [Herminiimonas sp.]
MTTNQKHSNHKPGDGTASQAKAAHLEERGHDARHEEALLDAAVEDTFPASDPVAELPAAASSTKVIDSEDRQLDKAIEATFPASDPVAISNITKIVPEKSDADAGNKKAH